MRRIQFTAFTFDMLYCVTLDTITIIGFCVEKPAADCAYVQFVTLCLFVCSVYDWLLPSGLLD